jgi:hypothetical protein
MSLNQGPPSIRHKCLERDLSLLLSCIAISNRWRITGFVRTPNVKNVVKQNKRYLLSIILGKTYNKNVLPKWNTCSLLFSGQKRIAQTSNILPLSRCLFFSGSN